MLTLCPYWESTLAFHLLHCIRSLCSSSEVQKPLSFCCDTGRTARLLPASQNAISDQFDIFSTGIGHSLSTSSRRRLYNRPFITDRFLLSSCSTIHNINRFLTMTRATLFLLITFLATVCAQQCSFTNNRTPTGLALRCVCPGVHDSTVKLSASVDVSPSCLTNCTNRLEASCTSGSAATFRAAARLARTECCPKCGGPFVDNMCQRFFLEGRPLFIPPQKGCINKVRATDSGHTYACRCVDGKNFEVPFFIATEVDEDCLESCGRPLLQKKCSLKRTEESMRRRFTKTFVRCCKSCGGVPKRGGSTCGFNI